jgi:hypothetical protein
MSAIRKTMAAALVSGVALAGTVQTAHAAESAAKPIRILKPFTAFGPAKNKDKKPLQWTKGTVFLTLKHRVTGDATNKVWNKKNPKTFITVKFIYTTTTQPTKKVSHPVVVKTRTLHYDFPYTGTLKTLSVQVFQGKKAGALVKVLP